MWPGFAYRGRRQAKNVAPACPSRDGGLQRVPSSHREGVFGDLLQCPCSVHVLLCFAASCMSTARASSRSGCPLRRQPLRAQQKAPQHPRCESVYYRRDRSSQRTAMPDEYSDFVNNSINSFICVFVCGRSQFGSSPELCLSTVSQRGPRSSRTSVLLRTLALRCNFAPPLTPPPGRKASRRLTAMGWQWAAATKSGKVVGFLGPWRRACGNVQSGGQCRGGPPHMVRVETGGPQCQSRRSLEAQIGPEDEAERRDRAWRPPLSHHRADGHDPAEDGRPLFSRETRRRAKSA